MQLEKVNVGALNKQNKKAWDDYHALASQQAAQLEAQKAAQVQAALASYNTSANTLTQNRDEAMRMANVSNSQQMGKMAEILGSYGLSGTGSGIGAYAKLLNSLQSKQSEIEQGYKGGITDLEKVRMQADADAEKSYADAFGGINKDMIAYYASLLANNRSSGGGGGGGSSSYATTDPNIEVSGTGSSAYNVNNPSTYSGTIWKNVTPQQYYNNTKTIKTYGTIAPSPKQVAKQTVKTNNYKLPTSYKIPANQKLAGVKYR